MSWPNSERSGAPLNVPVIFFASTSTHAGKPTFSASCSASTIRSWPFARSAIETTSPAAHDRGRHVQPLAVDEDRAVRHELPRFGARAAHAHPVDDVVQARLEQLQQVLAGRALALRRLGEVAAELPLEHAVDAAELLLLAQLLAVVGDAKTGLLSVLPRLGLELALGVERSTRAFQEKVGAFPSSQLAFGADISSQLSFQAVPTFPVQPECWSTPGVLRGDRP